MVVCLLLFCRLILRYLFCWSLVCFENAYIWRAQFCFLEIIQEQKLFVSHPITSDNQEALDLMIDSYGNSYHVELFLFYIKLLQTGKSRVPKSPIVHSNTGGKGFCTQGKLCILHYFLKFGGNITNSKIQVIHTKKNNLDVNFSFLLKFYRYFLFMYPNMGKSS